MYKHTHTNPTYPKQEDSCPTLPPPHFPPPMAFDHARGGSSIPPRSGSASRPRRGGSVSRGRSGSAASQPPPLHGSTVIVGGGNGGAGAGAGGGDAGSPRAAYQQARAQMQELEKDYQQAKESEGAARGEVRQMRGRLEAKEDEVRKLNLRVLQLSDAMDAAALQGEEEKHELRKQVEAESRSYRARAHNTKQLVAQLRQDALEAKVRYDDLKHGYDRAMESSERLHTELVHYEQKAAEEGTRATALDRRLSDAATQQQLWDTAEKTWVERVGRAEALVVEMERETAELARENEGLRGENEGLQIAVEEQRLEILQLQKKEGDVRASLVEAASAADMLVATRRQHGELAAREQEHLDLIKELRLEKQKMMLHLQAGIKERQAVIDSLTHGDIRGANPQLQMKIVEAEALKAEMMALVQRTEEESSTVQEYTAVLKAKADASDEKMKAVCSLAVVTRCLEH